MPTPSGIKDVSNTARDNKSAVTQKNNLYDRSASSLSNAWKGDAGAAFKDATKRVKTQMSAVLNGYGSLNSKLSSLSNSVKRAEAEEEAKRKVAAKK